MENVQLLAISGYASGAARRRSDRALHVWGLYHTSITVDNVKESDNDNNNFEFALQPQM